MSNQKTSERNESFIFHYQKPNEPNGISLDRINKLKEKMNKLQVNLLPDVNTNNIICDNSNMNLTKTNKHHQSQNNLIQSSIITSNYFSMKKENMNILSSKLRTSSSDISMINSTKDNTTINMGNNIKNQYISSNIRNNNDINPLFMNTSNNNNNSSLVLNIPKNKSIIDLINDEKLDKKDIENIDSEECNNMLINDIINKKYDIYKEIIYKMNLSGLDMSQYIENWNKKHDINKRFYYNFMKETDSMKLKCLISILYDEIDALLYEKKYNLDKILRSLINQKKEIDHLNRQYKEKFQNYENLISYIKSLIQKIQKLSYTNNTDMNYLYYSSNDNLNHLPHHRHSNSANTVFNANKHKSNTTSNFSNHKGKSNDNSNYDINHKGEDHYNHDIRMNENLDICDDGNYIKYPNKSVDFNRMKSSNKINNGGLFSTPQYHSYDIHSVSDNILSQTTRHNNISNFDNMLGDLINLIENFERKECINIRIENNFPILKNYWSSLSSPDGNRYNEFNNNDHDNQDKFKKQKDLLINLENKIKVLEYELTQLIFSNKQLQKINKEQETFKENNKLLIDELKNNQIEKDLLMNEYKKLEESFHQLKEDYNIANNHFETLIIEKESELKALKTENTLLKNRIEAILNKVRDKEQKNNELIAGNEIELRKLKERNMKLSDDYQNIEIENTKYKSETNELLNQIRTLETKISDFQSENDIIKATLATNQNLLKEKDDKIELLDKTCQELEKNVMKHKEQELYLKQIMAKELKNYEESLKEIASRAHEIEDENKILKIKFKDTENSKDNNNNNNIDELAIEQLARLLICKSNEGEDLHQDIKFRFCQIFGSNFISSLEILATKLKFIENEYIQLRERFQAKVWSSISKSDDIKWLIHLLFKTQETLERTNLNKQLELIHEDLMQKRIIFEKKLDEVDQEINSDKREIKEILELNISDSSTIYNFIQILNKKIHSEKLLINDEPADKNSEILLNKDFNDLALSNENEMLKTKLLFIQDELNALKSQKELKIPIQNISKEITMNKKPIHTENEDYLLLLHLQALSIEKLLEDQNIEQETYDHQEYIVN